MQMKKTLKEKIEMIRKMKKEKVIDVLMFNDKRIIINFELTCKQLQSLLIDLICFRDTLRNKYNVTIHDVKL
jgi:gas vesicle protein